MNATLLHELIPSAIDDFDAKVRAVPADRWDGPTPCTEWSVRDLVNHVTGEHLWAPHLLRGETLDQVGDRYDGDVVGEDPLGAWTAAAEQSRQSWLDAKAGSSVQTSMGPTPVEEYGEQMYMDLVVHGWDLARGAGLDDGIDAAAAEHILGYIEPQISAWAGYGVFADRVEGDFTEPSDRLLALIGRDPRR